MDAVLWSRAADIFESAIERPDGERKAFVEAVCEDDAEIRQTVIEMLDEDQRGISRLRHGVEKVVDQVLGEAPAVPPFVPPVQIGPYQRQEFLGRGGMGSVWKYLRANTAQTMAIKFLILSPQDPCSELWRKRFADEISTLARLRHPHIVSFHDSGTLNDATAWFAMDCVEERERGLRFTEHCRRSGLMVEEKLQLFKTVCEAVLYAHLQGTIHCDLKPSNILIARDGSPRIVDFGIARRLGDGQDSKDDTPPSFRMMSADYAPPEWKREGRIGVFTDVYSLGVILYEILSGRHPNKGAPHSGEAEQHENSRGLPEKPSVVACRDSSGDSKTALPRSSWNDLDRVCLTAMHPDPQERYSSVEPLLRDIDRYLKDGPLDAKPAKLSYPLGKYPPQSEHDLGYGISPWRRPPGLDVFRAS